MTQGRRIIAHLKRRPMTYMQMLMLGISTCPQKRVTETLREDEHLFKRKNARGLTTWFITR
jgi:hypothetical protein